MASRWRPDWAFGVLILAGIACLFLGGLAIMAPPNVALHNWHDHGVPIAEGTYLGGAASIAVLAVVGAVFLTCLVAVVVVGRGPGRMALGVAPVVLLVLVVAVHTLFVFLPLARGTIRWNESRYSRVSDGPPDGEAGSAAISEPGT